jgi:hypothetical protein
VLNDTRWTKTSTWRETVKTIPIALTACAIIASSAAADPVGVIPPADNSIVQLTHGHGGGGWGPNVGPNVGVLVDVPWEGMGYGNPPGPSPAPNQCREARHACFDQWGTDGREYGRCMRLRGC